MMALLKREFNLIEGKFESAFLVFAVIYGMIIIASAFGVEENHHVGSLSVILF